MPPRLALAALGLIVACNGASSTADSPAGISIGCAQYPGAIFCDDFENETPAVFGSNWGGTPYAPADPHLLEPIVITSDSAYSPNHMMHTEAEYVASEGSDGERLSEIVHGLPTLLLTQSVHVGFSFRIVAAGNDGAGSDGAGADLAVDFFTRNPGIVASCNVSIQNNALSGCVQHEGPRLIAMPIGVWRRVQIDADLMPAGSAAGTVTIAIDGQAVETGSFDSMPGSDNTWTGLLALGGAAFDPDIAPRTVIDLDDIVVEQQ